MGMMEENTRGKFELYYPIRDEVITRQLYLGDFDTLFEFSDGRRVLYDELSDRIRDIYPRDKSYLDKEEWTKEFSRKLYKKMCLKGVSQKELADNIGISNTAMSRLINGKCNVDVYLVQRIAAYLNCSVTELTNFDYLL